MHTSSAAFPSLKTICFMIDITNQLTDRYIKRLENYPPTRICLNQSGAQSDETCCFVPTCTLCRFRERYNYWNDQNSMWHARRRQLHRLARPQLYTAMPVPVHVPLTVPVADLPSSTIDDPPSEPLEPEFSDDQSNLESELSDNYD